MQSLENAQRRLTKRPRANTPPSLGFNNHFPAENSDSISEPPRKRVRKTIQLHQINVYQDEILSADSDNSAAQNEPALVSIGLETGKIWPHISVEISFRPDLQANTVKSTPKKGARKPLAALSAIALNGAQKALKIPQN